MTNQQHPITPPTELVQEWWESTIPNLSTDVKTQLCTQAAQWGADEELKAVCQLLYADLSVPLTLSDIRAARRPKPPSLKEQALALLDMAEAPSWDISDFSIVRQALEALPND